MAFYEMLLNADQYSSHLNYMDPICDFLYHMKYMFTGDSVKDQVSKQLIMILNYPFSLWQINIFRSGFCM